jgi:hypothetical protein
MLKLLKKFTCDAVIEIDTPNTFAVNFRTSPDTEDSAVFTLQELLELTDLLQLIRPLIEQEL